jgi:drug/metabolite transporter (DMT)-like permease
VLVSVHSSYACSGAPVGATVALVPRRTWLVVSFLTVCVVWGSTYYAIRVSIECYPPFLVGALRFLAAGVVLAVIGRWRGERYPTPRECLSLAVTGILFFVIGNGLLNVAEQSVSSGIASVLVATMPLWATVFGRFFGMRVTLREAAGVLLGLAGVAVLNVGGDLRASPIGGACALLAPMGWGLGSIASQRLAMPKGMMRTAGQMIAGGAAMVLVSAACHEHLSHPTLRSTLAVVYLGVFGSLVGFSAFSYLLAHTRPAVATSYAYVNPVIAILLGVLLAGEKFGPTSVLGTAIVLTAVVLVQRRASASRSRSAVSVTPWSPSNRSTTPSSSTTT